MKLHTTLGGIQKRSEERFSGEAPLESSEEINQSPHAGDASDPDSFGNQPHGANPSAPSSGPCRRRQRG